MYLNLVPEEMYNMHALVFHWDVVLVGDISTCLADASQVLRSVRPNHIYIPFVLFVL